MKTRDTNLLGQGGKEAHICIEAIGLLGGKRTEAKRCMCVHRGIQLFEIAELV